MFEHITADPGVYVHLHPEESSDNYLSCGKYQWWLYLPFVKTLLLKMCESKDYWLPLSTEQTEKDK